MLPFAHQHHRAIGACLLPDDAVQPVHKGTGEIHDLASGLIQRLQHLRRNAVAADEHLPALRLLRRSDGRHTSRAEMIHHVRVVNQLPQGAGGPSGVRHTLGSFHRAPDSHAEARVGSNLQRHDQHPFASKML